MLLASSSGCLCGTVCSGGTGDAGSAPRSAGEPCVSSTECAAGLSCAVASGLSGECLASCADGGACGAGLTCAEGWCQPTCSSCSKRFATTCDVDAGVCRPVSCHNGAGCPAKSTCAEPLWCCPVGTPCPSPLPGFCTL